MYVLVCVLMYVLMYVLVCVLVCVLMYVYNSGNIPQKWGGQVYFSFMTNLWSDGCLGVCLDVCL